MSLDDIFPRETFYRWKIFATRYSWDPGWLSNTIKLKTKLAKIIRQTVSHVGIDINCLFL